MSLKIWSVKLLTFYRVAKKVLGEIVESASNTVMITAKEKERIKCAEISGIGFSKIKLKALCK